MQSAQCPYYKLKQQKWVYTFWKYNKKWYKKNNIHKYAFNNNSRFLGLFSFLMHYRSFLLTTGMSRDWWLLWLSSGPHPAWLMLITTHAGINTGVLHHLHIDWEISCLSYYSWNTTCKTQYINYIWDHTFISYKESITIKWQNSFGALRLLTAACSVVCGPCLVWVQSHQ